MTDDFYNELLTNLGKDYADAAKKSVHSGSREDLHEFLRQRQLLKDGNGTKTNAIETDFTIQESKQLIA